MIYIYLMFKETGWTYDFIKYVFADMSIYSAKWVIKQINRLVLIYCTRKIHALFLTTAEIDTL